MKRGIAPRSFTFPSSHLTLAIAPNARSLAEHGAGGKANPLTRNLKRKPERAFKRHFEVCLKALKLLENHFSVAEVYFLGFSWR